MPKDFKRCPLLVFLSLALILSGCVRFADTPSSPAIGTPTAVAPITITAPTPWANVACPDFASSADFSPLLSHEVTPIAFPTNRELDGDRGPVKFSLRQAGGIVCEWSNRVSPHNETGRNPSYVGATVRVLPNAAERWKSYTDYYTGSADQTISCSPPGPTSASGACSSSALVGENWVDITFDGTLVASATDLETAARSIVERVGGVVRRAVRSETRWSAPDGTQKLNFGCDLFFTAAEARAALGSQSPQYLDGTDGGVSISSSAWTAAGSARCPWIDAEGVGGGGYHGWLPGGEWAWNETLSRATAHSYQKMAVSGLRQSDRAYIRCTATDQTCFAELVISHNWIEIAVDQIGPTAKTSSASVALAALAAATVRNLSAGQ